MTSPRTEVDPKITNLGADYQRRDAGRTVRRVCGMTGRIAVRGSACRAVDHCPCRSRASSFPAPKGCSLSRGPALARSDDLTISQTDCGDALAVEIQLP